MRDSLSTIAAHCARTLPDSISERKELLVALGSIITVDHDAWPEVNAQIAAIRSIEVMQKELPLKFQSSPKTPQGDGH